MVFRNLLSLLCLMSFSAYGITFTQDGITYSTEPISDYSYGEFSYRDYPNSQCVKVVSVSQSVSGDIQLPQKVENEGISYFVGGVDDLAFSQSDITSINMPSVTVIGANAFNGANKLTSVVLNNRVSVINDYAFSGCVALTSINLPEYMTRLGSGAFAGCGNLNAISLSYGSGIGEWCIYENKGIYYTISGGYGSKNAFFVAGSTTDVVLDEDCHGIDFSAFRDGITYVEFPAECSVTRGVHHDMGGGAFTFPSSVSVVKMLSSNPDWSWDYGIVFPVWAKILVPYGSKDSYAERIEREISDYEWLGLEFNRDNINEYGVVVKYNSGGNVNRIVEIDGGTSSSGLNSGSVIDGVSCKLGISPSQGYRIGKVMFNDIDITDQMIDNTLTLSEESAGVIEIIFEALPSLVVSGNLSSSRGTVYVNGEQVGVAPVVSDGDFEVEIVPAPIYKVSKLTIDGEDCMSQLVDGKITIAGNGTRRLLKVTFSQKQGVSLEYTGEGEIFINNMLMQNKQIVEGNEFDILILPADGWEIEKVQYNSQEYTDKIKNHHLHIDQASGLRSLTVTFREISVLDDASLTVFAPEQHTIVSSYPDGYCATVSFSPIVNWILKSITYNGENVVIESGNTFVTPALHGRNEISVVYEKDDISAVTDIEAFDDLALRVVDRTIYIDNLPEELTVNVFDIDGKMIASTCDNTVVVDGTASVVIVKVGARTFKVALSR